MFETQSDVELGLENGEQILAIGDKNQVVFVCGIISMVVIAFALMFVVPVLPQFASATKYLLAGLFFAGLMLLWFAKFTYNCYQYNQIYITDKRIIVTQKDRIDGIPFGEVKYFNSQGLTLSTLNLLSKRKFIFAFTDIKDVEAEFASRFSAYKKPFFTHRIMIFIIVAVLMDLVYFGAQYHIISNTTDDQTNLKVSSSDTYVEYMQHALKAHWTPPKLEQDAQVTVEFRILPDGTIFDEKVIETSGSREMDNSALFAIKSASPLRKLPKELAKKDGVKTNFTFDYNVLDENKK